MTDDAPHVEAILVVHGLEFGVSFDGSAWYVFERIGESHAWRRHCGPYAEHVEAVEWIIVADSEDAT